MNGPSETLPALIDKASAALMGAKSSAEVLEARDMARHAYDAAKSTLRIAKAKRAHDTLIHDVHVAQAHALSIRARAEMRLAEEYDAAQERDEVRKNGDRSFSSSEKLSPQDVGFTGRFADEARKLRDAEKANPGILQRTVDDMVAQGIEPSRAELKRRIIDEAPKAKVMNKQAMALWGRICDFERYGFFNEDIPYLVSEMTEPMRNDLRRLAPQMLQLMEKIGAKL